MTLTPTVLTDCRIYFDSVDLTGYGNKVEASAMAEDLDVTVWASGGSKQRTGGLFDADIKLNNFWQAGDLTQPDDAFWADLGNSVPLTLVPASGAVGSLAYLNRVFEANRVITGDVGKVLSSATDLKGNWPLVRGQIMHPQGTARTTSGSGTGIQLGAVTASQRLYACLHVLSVSGTTPSLTVKVQSNVDNTFAAPTDRITFTAATAVSGQASSLLGPVTDTWWRVTWTISGTTPSFLFAVSAGIGPK
jgi:hypothetical protein